MRIDRRQYFNYQRLLFYLLIALLFICIGIYNYRYVERHRKYEYESTIEKNSLSLNINDESTTTKSLYDRFKERRELMIQKCDEYQLKGNNGTMRQPNAWEFLINDKHKLVWCNVFKAASTSWFYNFNLLAGYNKTFLDKTHKTPVTVARKKYPRPSTQKLYDALKDHLSFIIVRHPFERLISAYRDKFSKPYNPFFIPIGNEIIKTMRENALCNGTYPPTFEEFINYIICQWQYGAKINEHWIPIYNFCTPCLVNFDLILKVETLNEDQDFLINLADIQNIVKSTWKNSAKNAITDDGIKKYFSNLSDQQFYELAEMFRFDLELFGYSTKRYEKYTRYEEDLPFMSEDICKKLNDLNKKN